MKLTGEPVKGSYLNNIDVSVGSRVRLSPAVRRHGLANNVVQVEATWPQAFLLLLMESLQIVYCHAGPAERVPGVINHSTSGQQQQLRYCHSTTE